MNQMFKIKNPIHASKVHKHQKIMNIIKICFFNAGTQQSLTHLPTPWLNTGTAWPAD